MNSKKTVKPDSVVTNLKRNGRPDPGVLDVDVIEESSPDLDHDIRFTPTVVVTVEEDPVVRSWKLSIKTRPTTDVLVNC